MILYVYLTLLSSIISGDLVVKNELSSVVFLIYNGKNIFTKVNLDLLKIISFSRKYYTFGSLLEPGDYNPISSRFSQLYAFLKLLAGTYFSIDCNSRRISDDPLRTSDCLSRWQYKKCREKSATIINTMARAQKELSKSSKKCKKLSWKISQNS